MKELLLRELIKYKKLPFNIYNEKGQIIMYSGDLLTTGKLMELKNMPFLLYDENFDKKSEVQRENPLIVRRKVHENSDEYIEDYSSPEDKNIQRIKEKFRKTIPTVNSRLHKEKQETFNKLSIFSKNTQDEFKMSFLELMDCFEARDYENARTKVLTLAKRIEEEFLSKYKNARTLMQLKLFGEYKTCHSLNVALFSAFISYTTANKPIEIRDIILSGLLHDVGKTRIDQYIAYKHVLYIPEQAEYEKHVIIGYKIIKEILKLGSIISKPALEHHTMLDGSGYPKGIALDSISDLSKIIALSNFIDNLTSHRLPTMADSGHEVGKILLGKGSRKFPVEIIYGLANKYLMNDTNEFKDMMG